MARTIAEIKQTITDAFMADPLIREKYGLSADDTFDASFSPVSLENLLFHIIATICHVLESLFDIHRKEVEAAAASASVATVPWYHRMSLQFQLGDPLVLDPVTGRYHYASIDESRRIVRYAAVRDRGTSVDILVSKDTDGSPEPLSGQELQVFAEYMQRIKIAGVVLNISSLPADPLTISATVSVDPLVIDTDGRRLADGTRPVEEAVRQYLKNIVYGGTFNKTRLVDAIQAVEGVEDVELNAILWLDPISGAWTPIAGNNYTGHAGSYTPHDIENTLRYAL